jgi:hypothetical protein
VEELTQFLASCEFASPLLSGIGVALVLLLIFLPLRRKRRGFAMDLQYWQTRVAFKSKSVWILSILVAIASILMAAVLTNPQFTAKRSVALSGKPVLAIVDVSGSMGMAPVTGGGEPVDARTNFDKARGVFDDLISRWPDVDFGLLIYSTESYLARYFAYKNELLKDTMENRSEIDFISSGTRPVEALVRAREFLADNVKGKDKAIVLISDLDVDFVTLLGIGEEMQKDLLAGIRVYVISVGGEPGGAHWDPRQAQAKEGLLVVSMYDKEGIDRICRELSEMRSAPLEEDDVLSKKSLVPFLVSPVLGLIALCQILSETRFRKIP